MQINDATVRAAAPGLHWDEKLKGFGLWVGKNSRTFLVRVGRGRHKKIGRWPLLSVAKAKEAAKTVLAERHLGKILPTRVAYEDAKKEYLDDCRARLKPATLEAYTWCLNQLPFSRKSLGDITTRDIASFLKRLTPSNREHIHRASRTFFRWAVSQDLLPVSPMEKLGAPETGKSRERVLTEDELRAIYAWAKQLQSPHQRFTWLMIRFGQRPGETIRLHLDYISKDRITLPSTLEGNKMAREHAFPITEDDYNLIAQFFQRHGKFFPPARTHVRGKACHYMAFNQDFRKVLVEETKTSGWWPNDLRRTLSTYWAEKLEVPPHLIERQINHVSGTVSGVAATYNRARYVEQIRPHMERWRDYLDRLEAA